MYLDSRCNDRVPNPDPALLQEERERERERVGGQYRFWVMLPDLVAQDRVAATLYDTVRGSGGGGVVMLHNVCCSEASSEPGSHLCPLFTCTIGNQIRHEKPCRRRRRHLDSSPRCHGSLRANVHPAQCVKPEIAPHPKGER